MGRRSKNINKNNQPHTQVGSSTHQQNTQIQVTEPPNKRKKRILPVEQVVQTQQPRQSVFERLGTKISGTAPILRQPTVKKDIKDHLSENDTRKSKKLSEVRKTTEHEQLEGEPRQQESIKPKERQHDVKNKPEGVSKRIIPNSKPNSNIIAKDGKREESKPGNPLWRNSYKQKEQKQPAKKDEFIDPKTTSSLSPTEIQETKEEDITSSHEIPLVDISLQSPKVHDVQNTEQPVNDIKETETQKINENDQITPENLEKSVASSEFIVQQQNNAIYEHISGLAQSDHESDIAKEDVVSIQADDDYLIGIEDEDQEDPSLSANNEQQLNQNFGESHETGQPPALRNIPPNPDSYKDQRKDHGRNKDIDIIKDIPSRMRNRTANSDDGRTSDRSYERPSRETSIQQCHVDDRRTRLYERDIREREREERYNRAIATDRAHDDRISDRDRRERERQDRYNKSLLEDKAHLDVPRRDRFQREVERGRNDHGNRTPNAETSSNSTIRGAASMSPSESDRDRKPPSRTRSLEKIKREGPRDDLSWEHRQPHQDFQRDRISRQREDLSNRDRDSRIRDLSKEKDLSRDRVELPMQDRDPMNFRRGDQMDVAFRRLDERVSVSNVRRLGDPRNNTGIPDRNQRDPPPRDREKDSHYHRDQALRSESIRREERLPIVRPKNETQNDTVFQDTRDREPRQRSVQSNAPIEHDHRPDKRKREEIDSNDRKVYYDREQRSDSNSFNQRIPDYRIRDKDRDQRHREDYPAKVGINRDQDRDRKEERVSPLHDRNVGLPDLYRPSSEHHLKEPDRRPIREYERDVGGDRFRADYDREIRDRLRDGHESPSNSVEKTDAHKHLYDRHQREPEKRMGRDVDDDSMSRANRPDPTRRVDTERSPSAMDNQRDNTRDYAQEIHMREDKSGDSQAKESKKALDKEDEEYLPHPWIKCKSSKNKDYYFNTQTRESRWNHPFPFEPENGKSCQTQSGQTDGIKTIGYDSRKVQNEFDNPRKKIRLNESGDGTATNTDNRSFQENPQIGNENKILKTINENETSNNDVSLIVDKATYLPSDSSFRLPRNNTTNDTALSFSPSIPQAQSSPGMTSVFSPPHRSISSGYNERRFSADYGIQSSTRRGSYAGSQPKSPLMPSSRPSSSPFNRSGSVDLYDRNDVFRNEDFISNRSLGDPRNITNPSGNNNSGMGTPTFSGSPIRSNRPGMYNSFGIDQNTSPGSRRSRELPSFSQQSPTSRARNVLDEERPLYGEEEQNTEIKELPISEVHVPERSEMDIDVQMTNNGQNVETVTEQNIGEESDEDTWRSDNELTEYGASETEPVSIFLFRRAGSRTNQDGVKKKYLNSRKEYEMVKSIYGGKGMHRFKHSFATVHRGNEIFPSVARGGVNIYGDE
ncbi:1984_t:CDS:2 [Funneliformis geosporum]|uniref:21_t:CDS:1 n=1 Tax=Funneliformis geosporum TaxID=1117311 RepID=A0A9W4SDM4_9GLOM|nr:1984_t:CDS:2 [Funneliformis geosporum]CAI2165817.1 21_t:CDS:2 [Funneliformis geosporum]